MKKLNIEEIAELENLEVIETTVGMNGYPKNIKSAIVGFESFEHAQKLANEYGLSIESFTKRDGWHLWNRNNNTVYEPYKNSAEDYGDNYTEIPKMDETDFIESEMRWFLEDVESFEEIDKFIKIKREVWECIEIMEDDEIVILHEGSYYETIKKESMAFSHDTRNYIIGLI